MYSLALAVKRKVIMSARCMVHLGSRSAFTTSSRIPFQEKPALSLFRSSCCAKPDFGSISSPRIHYFSTHSSDADATIKDSSDQQVNNELKGFKTLHRVWRTILGAGPALRVGALMIRNVWHMEMIDLKYAYYSKLSLYRLSIVLLRADVDISLRLMAKISRGFTLSRRERQLLTRAAADIFRLVPISVYIVIPLIEVLLPVFLRFYPNILPLSFKEKIEEQEPAVRKLKAREEFVRFLHDTASEIAKVVQTTFESGEIKPTAEEFIQFATKVLRRQTVLIDEVFLFARLFSDELIVYNIDRPMLVTMCKCMGISPLGTDEYLRFILQERLKFIKEDDKLIQAKGVESLSEAELRKACRERGIDVAEEMHRQLRDWLDLSLDLSLSSSILILSRSYNEAGKYMPAQVVLHALYILPYELKHLVMASLPCKSRIYDKLIKLESIDLLQKLIKEEEKEKELPEMKQSDAIQDDMALKKMTISMPDQEARAVDKQKQHISDAITVLSSALNVCMECEKLSRFADKKDDTMLQDPVKEIDDMDAGGHWQVLDRYCDGKVGQDVVTAATFLKNALDKEGIKALLSILSKYKDELVKLDIEAEEVNQVQRNTAAIAKE